MLRFGAESRRWNNPRESTLMKTSTKTALLLGPPFLFPIEVFRLARRPTENPFGNSHAMLFVMTVGGVLALVYAGVALWKWRTGKEHPLPWLLAGGIATSPIAYFVLWNLFFRSG